MAPKTRSGTEQNRNAAGWRLVRQIVLPLGQPRAINSLPRFAGVPPRRVGRQGRRDRLARTFMADSSTAWYFALTGPLTFTRITKKAFRSFFFDGGSFVIDSVRSEGDVKLGIVNVALRDGREASVFSLDYMRFRLDKDGRWEAAHQQDSRALAGQMWPGPGSQIALLRRRMEVQHEWKPTREQVAALAAEIERCAGRYLPYGRPSPPEEL